MVNINHKKLGKTGRKVQEKVEYKGEYRIVGTVWSNNQEVGYGVIDVKTYQLRLFTKVQTLELMKRFKFENAEVENGVVRNTECAMTRLLKFNTQGRVIGNAGITVLGKIYTDGDKAIGFRVMDAQGKVVDLREQELLSLSRQVPHGLLNAKKVEGTSGYFISAIKNNFKRIEKLPVEETQSNIENRLTKNEDFIKKQHAIFLNKVASKLVKEVIVKGYISPITSRTKKREVSIFLREFTLARYPEFKKCKESKVENVVLASILLYISQHGEFKTNNWNGLNSNGRNVIVTTFSGKRSVKTTLVEKELLDVVEALDTSGDAKNFLKLRNDLLEDKHFNLKDQASVIRHPKLRKTLSSLYNYIALRLEKKRKHDAKPHFNTAEIDYQDAVGIAQFGYTLDMNLVGKPYNSVIYGEKPLRHIFDGILGIHATHSVYLLDNISCFGDVEILRKLQEIKSKVPRTDKLKGLAEQLYLFILAMHNPIIAEFASRHFEISPQFSIDEISRENFFLSEEDILYYQSGLKFSKEVTLSQKDSWQGLNSIPKATYEALCLYLLTDNDTEMFTKTPRIQHYNNHYSIVDY